MNSRYLAALIALCLSGCSSLPTLAPKESSVEDMTNPPVGRTVTVYAGDRMLETFTAWRGEAFVSASDKNMCDQNALLKYPLPSGQVYKAFSGSDGRTYFCGDSENPIKKTYVRLCITQSPEGYWHQRNQYPSLYKCYDGENRSPLSGEVRSAVVKQEDSLQRTVIYNGRSGNDIFVSYREYMANISRPSFTQDFTFDMSQERQFGVKGSLFQVDRFDNSSITYKVVRPILR